MAGDDHSNVLRTTATSIEILNLLDEFDGAGITQLADHMGKPKSTVHGHLTTLKSKQFVITEGDIYMLGPELLRLGNTVRTRKQGYVLAHEYTERLYSETGFRSVFAVEMGGRAVFMHTASGNKLGWTHERLGNQLYLHDTAVGKAILATLPPQRVDQIIDRWGLPAETEHTITDPDTLRAQLTEIREQGYAVNHEENIKGLHGLGVAATEQSGNVIGGFSITGAEHPFSGENTERELAKTVTEIVNKYELELSLSRE